MLNMDEDKVNSYSLFADSLKTESGASSSRMFLLLLSLVVVSVIVSIILLTGG